MSFSIHWNVKIGMAGNLRRHLVLPGALGDTHILLKILSNRMSTGIIDNDQQAKSLIQLILQNIKTDYMVIEVFPEDRDSVTGEWERSEYSFNEFVDAVNAVAKQCDWDVSNPIGETVLSTPPAPLPKGPPAD
jgi:hypothetical protein